jgi:hypothetical protein
MTWLQPIAWLGLLAVVIPIVVHLLGRPRARLVRFPTLRFLELTRDAPTRRAVPTDLLLLALRLGIVLLAVVALARPVWPDAAGGARASGIARAVLIDTSSSMARLTTTGTPMLVEARRLADSLAAGASEFLLVPSVRPGDALPGASAWLTGRGGRPELVVISDFQVGAFTADDTVSLAPGVGLSFVRLTAVATDTVVRTSSQVGNATIRAEAVRRGAATRTSWTVAPGQPVAPAVRLLGEGAAVEAVEAAVRATVARTERPTTDRTVVVVLPDDARRATLLAGARMPDEAWQGDLLRRISRHPLLLELARDADDSSGTPAEGPAPVVITGDGVPVVAGGVAAVDGINAVVLFPAAGTTPLLWAGLVAATSDAAIEAPAVEEQDPATLPDALLAALGRAAAPAAPGADAPSLARWVWLTALILLGIEWLVRRRPARSAPSIEEQETRERVA